MWGRVNHKNVVKIFRLYESEEEDKMYVWMQYADMGQIADSVEEKPGDFTINTRMVECVAQKVGNDREKIVAFIFKGVAEGVNYLHNVLKMANRDIKPENILFATNKHGTNNTHEDRAQIADFTTVVQCQSEEYEVSGEAGTMAFMAPECFNKGKPYRPKPTDIWAIGVSIYVLMFDKLPFDLTSDKTL